MQPQPIVSRKKKQIQTSSFAGLLIVVSIVYEILHNWFIPNQICQK